MPSPPYTPGTILHQILQSAFRVLTTLALLGSILSTAAYFTTTPAFLAQLSPFRVQYAALLLAHTTFCLLLRRPRWATLFATVALFNLLAVLRPLPPPPHSSLPAPRPLKILLANVLTSNLDPAPLLALIATEQPDLIALLEINHRWQTQLTPALATTYPHTTYLPRSDNFGLAILSRTPTTPPQLTYFADPELPSLAFNLTYQNRPLRILLTHPLPPGTPATTALRDQHLSALVPWVAAETLSDPTQAILILGDLNSTPWCPPLRHLLTQAPLHLAARPHHPIAPTWPTAIPFLRIPLDHALLNSALLCTAYHLGPDIGSDHLPVILEIQFASPQTP